MMSKDSDKKTFMNRAAFLALKGRGQVEPNPMVGAVFVKNRKIIAEGYHECFGKAHAEVKAIQDAQSKGISLKGSTLYVNLEPCCHHGKQGPCTEALIKIEVKKIIYAAKDPNPKVKSQGIQALENAGIECEHFETSGTEQLNEIYLVNTTKKRPFIHLKTACTLDGKITLKASHQTSLTNEKSNQKTHDLRAQYNAILIGINTLLIDNPKLTVRHTTGPNPTRIILDSQLKALKHPELQIFKEPGRNILASTISPPSRTILPKNTHILPCSTNNTNQIDLPDLLQKLLDLNIRSILVEGGESINTSFLNANLIDQLTLIITPHLSQNKNLPTAFKTNFPGASQFSPPRTHRIQDDLWLEMHPCT